MGRTAWRRIGAATALVMAIMAPVGRVEAGIRLTVKYDPGGGSEVIKYFYDPSETFLSTGVFTVGQYTGTIGTTVSNWPGLIGAGTLSQTINLGVVGGSPDPALNLSAFSEVITDALGLLAGEITGGANIATLLAQTLLPFTSPDTNPLVVSSDVGAATNVTNTVGDMLTETIVNGVSVFSSQIAISSPVDAIQFQNVVNGPPSGYTLSQRVTILGPNVGSSGIPVVGSSSVQPVPAPAGLMLWASGAPMLALGWYRRRRTSAVA